MALNIFSVPTDNMELQSDLRSIIWFASLYLESCLPKHKHNELLNSSFSAFSGISNAQTTSGTAIIAIRTDSAFGLGHIGVGYQNSNGNYLCGAVEGRYNLPNPKTPNSYYSQVSGTEYCL